MYTCQRQWIKLISAGCAAELEWAMVHYRILYNKWYMLDTQDTNPKNTKMFLLTVLRRGQYQNFRVHGTACPERGPFPLCDKMFSCHNPRHWAWTGPKLTRTESDGSYDGLSEDSKKTVWNYWHGQICTQKIEVETSKNNCSVQWNWPGRAQREELRSTCD